MKKVRLTSLPKTIIAVFLVFFGVGALGLSFDTSRQLFISLMPFSLLLSMGLMFLMHRNFRKQQLWVFAVIALLGFLVEIAGVLTGVVFGDYAYGRALGFKMWGTPPLIGLNWLMLIYAVWLIVSRIKAHPLIRIFAGASLMVVYDLIMEPVAIQLDMWSWGGGDIPVQNYIAWFVISFVMLGVIRISGIKYENQVAPYLFFVQMGFFLVLNFTLYLF